MRYPAYMIFLCTAHFAFILIFCITYDKLIYILKGYYYIHNHLNTYPVEILAKTLFFFS